MPYGMTMPKPLHMLKAQALRAGRPAWRTVTAAPVAELVTRHVPPWRSAAVADLPRPAAAFARAAENAGLAVAGREARGRAVQVGVRERDGSALWMRATWTLTPSGLWTSRGVHVHHVLMNVTAAKALWK